MCAGVLFASIRVHSRPYWFFLCSYDKPFGAANEREVRRDKPAWSRE